MKRNFKKILIILSIIIALLGAVGYLIGDYFVNYALVRPESGQLDSANDPNAPKNEENAVVEANMILEETAYLEWVETVEVNNVSIQSYDNLKLNAIEYRKEDSDKWIIMVHGYTSSNQSMVNRAVHYGEKGYNVLLPNNRAHGDSEGTYIGMGWLDRLDIIDWIEFIIDENPEAEIALYGVSMGGATVSMVSGEKLPDNVKVVIEDCGYTSAWAMFENQLDYRFGLPPFPVLDLAGIVGNMRTGYDLKDADSIAQLEKSTLPILFIHGDIDNYVPVEMVYEMYEASNSVDKEILIIEGSNHAESDYVNPEVYYEAVFRYLDKYID